AQATSLDLWEAIDPLTATRKPLSSSRPPSEPLISDYPKAFDRRPPTPRATRSTTAGDTADEAPDKNTPVPFGTLDIYRAGSLKDLSPTTLKQYLEAFSTYTAIKRFYNEKKKVENALISWMQGTVSTTLQLQCCSGDEDVSQWILNLHSRFSITENLHKQRADRAQEPNPLRSRVIVGLSSLPAIFAGSVADASATGAELRSSVSRSEHVTSLGADLDIQRR
ncbi:hypothetical protein CMUS01_13526, partial [Colletotrichum musicola]